MRSFSALNVSLRADNQIPRATAGQIKRLNGFAHKFLGLTLLPAPSVFESSFVILNKSVAADKLWISSGSIDALLAVKFR